MLSTLKLGSDVSCLMVVRVKISHLQGVKDEECHNRNNLFIYQARESSLVPAEFLTAQFLQKL